MMILINMQFYACNKKHFRLTLTIVNACRPQPFTEDELKQEIRDKWAQKIQLLLSKRIYVSGKRIWILEAVPRAVVKEDIGHILHT